MCANCITTPSLEVGRGVRCIILRMYHVGAGRRAFLRLRFDTRDYNCRAWIVTRAHRSPTVIIIFKLHIACETRVHSEVRYRAIEGGTTRVTMARWLPFDFQVTCRFSRYIGTIVSWWWGGREGTGKERRISGVVGPTDRKWRC